MPMLASLAPKLGMVVRRLEGDIRARGLQPGDRYLTVAEAALMLNVSPATAHRAMDQLVSRDLLVRHHGRGTFIGEGVERTPSTRAQTILILSPEETETLLDAHIDAAIVHGIRSTFKGATVQFSSVPNQGSLHFVRELIEGVQRNGQLAGVIARSCSRDVYRLLGELGHPVVVLGSLYADQQHLPSIDLNYNQIGQMLTGHILRGGHRSIALLIAGEGRPGDHAFYSGVSNTLAEAGLPHNALAVRIFPREFGAFRAQVHELLARADRPSAVICGMERFVPVVVEVASSLHLSIPTDLEIAYQGQSTNAAQQLPYVHTEPQRSFYEIAELLAAVLKQKSEGIKPQTDRVVIDVQLCHPEHVSSLPKR